MSENVLKDEGGYYYEDDDGDWIGPFSTYEQAKVAYDAYVRWETREHKHYANRKMRDEGV